MSAIIRYRRGPPPGGESDLAVHVKIVSHQRRWGHSDDLAQCVNYGRRSGVAPLCGAGRLAEASGRLQWVRVYTMALGDLWRT
jgi:hypothetical protein